MAVMMGLPGPAARSFAAEPRSSSFAWPSRCGLARDKRSTLPPASLCTRTAQRRSLSCEGKRAQRICVLSTCFWAHGSFMTSLRSELPRLLCICFMIWPPLLLVQKNSRTACQLRWLVPSWTQLRFSSGLGALRCSTPTQQPTSSWRDRYLVVGARSFCSAILRFGRHGHGHAASLSEPEVCKQRQAPRSPQDPFFVCGHGLAPPRFEKDWPVAACPELPFQRVELFSFLIGRRLNAFDHRTLQSDSGFLRADIAQDPLPHGELCGTCSSRPSWLCTSCRSKAASLRCLFCEQAPVQTFSRYFPSTGSSTCQSRNFKNQTRLAGRRPTKVLFFEPPLHTKAFLRTLPEKAFRSAPSESLLLDGACHRNQRKSLWAPGGASHRTRKRTPQQAYLLCKNTSIRLKNMIRKKHTTWAALASHHACPFVSSQLSCETLLP